MTATHTPPRVRGRRTTAVASAPASGDGPFKGLGYYEEADAPYFFGREQETRIVAANLVASRLTVLYGDSGVGKSSLLRAGVTRHLMEIARENVERRGAPRQVVAVFPSDERGVHTTWRDDPVPAIAGAISRAVEALGLDVPSPTPGSDLCRLLSEWTERLGSDVLLILDQFEEYMLYHEGEDGEGTLAVELPRVVSQPNLRANVLISIRQDMLARLDTFKRRIPTIFDTCVRVDRLSRQDARAAIEKPIDRYNDVHPGGEQIAIEPRLVDALLHELEAGRVVVGLAGAGTSQARAGPDPHPVETPFLQLVMTRLWAAEAEAGSTTLRLGTLEGLGHCERIIKTHLDDKMRTLPRYARTVAAQAFHHLVTPSGAKIAHTPADLAEYSGLPEEDIEPVLERLTEHDYRILRRVVRSTAGDTPAQFEIFHDVLGTPILDWRARYLRAREVLQILRGGVTAFVHIAFGLVAIFLLVASIVDAATTDEWETSDSSSGLLIAWAASAVLIWLSTTVVLVKRRQRREAWVVPLVGVVAAAIGPVTALVTGLLWLIGRWQRRRPQRRMAAAQRSGAGRLLRFSGLLSLIAAGVMLLALGNEAVSGEYYTSSADDYRPVSAALLDGGDVRWLALQPIAASVLVGIAGLLAITRPRSRQFLPGVVSGMGIAALAYFFALLCWPAALSPLMGVPARSDELYLTAGTGILFGLAGAALMLVSSAALIVLDVFASIIGAGRTLAGSARPAPRLDPIAASSRLQKPLGALGLAAAVVVLAATFGDSSAWQSDGSESLFELKFWAAFLVLVPAIAGGTAALVFAYSAGVSARAAGCISGAGLALTATFLGVAASAPDATTADSIALGAGVVLSLTGSAALAASRSGGRTVPVPVAGSLLTHARHHSR